MLVSTVILVMVMGTVLSLVNVPQVVRPSPRRSSAWRRRRRRAGRLSHARPNHANLGPCLASAVFIIGTPDECCYIELSIAIHLGPIQPNSHSLEACAEGTDHLCGADLILMTDRSGRAQA